MRQRQNYRERKQYKAERSVKLIQSDIGKFGGGGEGGEDRIVLYLWWHFMIV